jgi:hypothetical protein
LRISILNGLDVVSSDLVIAAPGAGDGFGPSAVLAGEYIYRAKRLRRPVRAGRGYANVVARSAGGLRFERLCPLHRDDLGGASLERPAPVRAPVGGWRIRSSLSPAGSKHWWIDAFDAQDPADLASRSRVSDFSQFGG